jgi:hypothetical protein
MFTIGLKFCVGCVQLAQLAEIKLKVTILIKSKDPTTFDHQKKKLDKFLAASFFLATAVTFTYIGLIEGLV